MNVPTGRSVISNGVLYETSVSYPSLVADLFFKSFILCSQVVKYAFRSYRMVHNYGGLESFIAVGFTFKRAVQAVSDYQLFGNVYNFV